MERPIDDVTALRDPFNDDEKRLAERKRGRTRYAVDHERVRFTDLGSKKRDSWVDPRQGRLNVPYANWPFGHNARTNKGRFEPM